ncbi:MAG TPA: maleylpyruvate isomerase family mycothiol-dependent enzyme [Acidimicrobiia bacterium]
MTYDEYVATLRAEAEAFAAAATDAPLDRHVPSCPEWTVADLARHLGIHHRWVTANVGRPPADGPASLADRASPPEGAALVGWIPEGADALARHLERTGPAAPSWTWTGDQTAAFWARRTAIETSIHRWDVENAVGAPAGFAPPVAADAIDEFLSIMPVRVAGVGGTIHLHTTDTEGEWLVRLDDGGAHVTREHAKGDVALRGPASELLLVVLGRRTPSSVDRFGDDALCARWLESARF